MPLIRSRWALPSYIFLCLVLGGASSAGYFANAALQICAAVIVFVVLWTRPGIVGTPNNPFDGRILFWIAAIFLAWSAIQLIPLPPEIWHALPGRGFVKYGDGLLGMENVWRPVSLQPSQTLISITGILPPLAVLLLTTHSTAASRSTVIWMIIAVAVASAFLGVIQLFQPSSGGVYLYKVTNYGASVGFFANSNHLATLFLVAILFSSQLPTTEKKRADDKSVLYRILRIILIVFFTVNVIVNGSVAGIGLLVAVLTYVALQSPKLVSWIVRFPAALGTVLVVVCLAVGMFVWSFSGNTLTFAQTSVEGEDRLEFARNTFQMISDAFPVGNGLGTFSGVYLGYENLRTVTMTYVNHAHNDYLEIVADLGVVALIIMILYALWFSRRIVWLWSTRVAVQPHCYAAAMAIIVVLAHSAVDYPLRTSAIASIFAFATGCLAYPVVDKVSARKFKHAKTTELRFR